MRAAALLLVATAGTTAHADSGGRVVGKVTVTEADGKTSTASVDAIVYVALMVGEGLRPTREYLGHLLAGGDLLPADYWAWLEATPTLD